METTIVQPGASPSIYTTGDRGHGHHHHDDRRGFDAVDARADFRSLSNDIERSTSVNGDRINTVGQITGDRITAVGSAGALASCRTNELVQAAACRTDQLIQGGFGDTSDRICASTKDVTAAVGSGFTASALASCKTDDLIAAMYAATQKQVSDAATSTLVGFKDLTALSYQVEGRGLLEAAKNANAAAIQLTAVANAASVQALTFASAAEVRAERIASAAELRAQQIAAEAAKEAAACCCRLEMQAAANLAAITATVVAQTQMGRDQVAAIESDRKSERIRFLETQVLVLGGGATARAA